MIRRLSKILSDFDKLSQIYAVLVIIVIIGGILTIPSLEYQADRLYPKTIQPESPLDPYDRGGTPFEKTEVLAEYPENSPYLGYVTAYLTPFSLALATLTHHVGTTIVAHPGGIIDEILYNTRGLDTVVETSILFVAFGVASFLFLRRDEE